MFAGATTGFVLLTGLLLCASSEAEPIEGTIFFPGEPSFGSVMHTGGNGKEMAALGVNWARLGFSWARTEKHQKGQYDLAGYEKKVEHYRSHGINILGILAWHYYCKKFYPDPKTEEGFKAGVEGFTNWARACATRFRGKVPIWEIGNEPQCFPVGKVNKPERYVRLARATAQAVREVDPDVHIAALSTAWMDRGFITKCLELDLLQDGTIDAISFHGYHRKNIMPESRLQEDVRWLREMIRKHAPKDKKIIVIDSERGYALVEFLKPKHWASWRNIVYTESAQAAYLARHYLEEIFLGIEISTWYKDMRGEHGYSLYTGRGDSRIRPMGYVMRNLARLLDTNPKQLVNDKYNVSLVDLPDKICDPNTFVKVRSFVRTYLKADESREKETLVIALWNPIEAFDGNILESRKRIKEHYYEAWRAISPDDVVEVPVQVTISRLTKDRTAESYLYNLLAQKDSDLRSPIKLTFDTHAATTETTRVGPTPTVIVVEIKNPRK